MEVMEWVIGSVAFIALGISVGTLVVLCIVFRRNRR